VIAEQNPHLALIDVGLTDISGIELARQLRQRHPRVAVLILSMHDNPDYVAQAVRAGARGYVLKNSSTQQIIAAIDAVAAGGTYFSSDVIGAVSAGTHTNLSNREQDVLNHIVEGRSSKEIARLLKLSARTVETHRQTIKRKLGIDSSAGLVKWAIKNGLAKL
jgi:DNA-binding NarL/FixJ family response regulator